MQIRKILYPTDFSEHAHAALAMAESIAKANAATIVIAHVHEPEMIYGVGMAAAYASVSEEIQQDSERMLECVQLSDASIPLERRMLAGSPASSICDYASQHDDIDLIVMATHGRSGISRFVMGSVAEAVVRSAPCPVLTLSTTAHPPVG